MADPQSIPNEADAESPGGARAAKACAGDERSDIALTIAGDGEAFRRIVLRHQAALGRYAWHFTRDRRIQEELVQTTFVEVFQQLHNYRGRGPFQNWLWVIATRVGMRHWKEQRRRRQLGVEALSSEPEAARDRAVEANEAAEVVHRLLARLPDRDRLILTLCYLESKTMAEIAEITGWSQVMVKVQAFRARKKLQAMLAEDEA